jgi:thiol peroxidase
MGKKIKFKAAPLSLAGRKIKEGMLAPFFSAINIDLKEITLSDFKDSIKLITSFLSLDTSVCDTQVKEFNKRAKELSDDIAIIGISQDLPFAQKRFCEFNKIDKVKILSDYKINSFGINYGLFIKELHLLARAVLIVDKNDIIRYIQIVEELSNPPDYKAVLIALKEVINKPSLSVSGESQVHCVPCVAGTPPLAKNRVEQLFAGIEGWELVEDKKIKKTFKFNDFLEAKYFVDIVSVIAQEQGHHPNIKIVYNKVTIILSTHAIGGLSENDFIMAGIIDGAVDS